MIYIPIFVNIVLLLLFDYRCLSFSLCSACLRPPGIIFLLRKVGRNTRPRLDGKIRSTAERKIFPAHPCGGLPALAKAGTVGYFCSKIVPQEVARLNGAETPE